MWNFGPWFGLFCDAQVLIKWCYLGAEVFKQHVRGDYAVLYSQRCLQQAGNSSCALSVPNDSFDAANIQTVGLKIMPISKKGLGNCFSLLWITCWCSRACTLSQSVT